MVSTLKRKNLLLCKQILLDLTPCEMRGKNEDDIVASPETYPFTLNTALE